MIFLSTFAVITLLIGWFHSNISLFLYEKFTRIEWRLEREDLFVYIEDFRWKGIPIGEILTCKICFSFWASFFVALLLSNDFLQFAGLWLASPGFAILIYLWLLKEKIDQNL